MHFHFAENMIKLYLDRSPIHIIKSKVVQVGGRHLRVSFLYEKIPTQSAGIFMLGIYKTNYLIYSEVRHVSLG
ncbi:hypothetical protein C6352_27095 [Bacillus thuringiensis]|uniref:Uncharacterized protein n=1 Tax=Bacillus wiedmannii TaxID=1890302 RepID=A0ABX5DM26_9BACI|nr:hypothetical protein C6356_29975 [Bacillus wiedmannii]PRT04305.1 hypothetical protein C6352_27095 [Bacillus thuringiensis]PRT14377.1 hypothetical protein C6353_24445 [Bacillus toyonensis]PRT15119.1 hypothetical protein C6360_28530 [Bacillus wiedmannii]PRT37032.1 hypothetical protein C6357_27175 [Bacillus wiedmannii]